MAGLVPDLPESLSGAKEYLVKAVQFTKISPVVSHYCKVYFLERALEVRDKKDKDASTYLMKMMDEVEQEKTVLGDVEDPKMQVEEMALKVFVKADNQYYAGKADLSTAKTFRSAATLMEVCRQFGELDIDVAEKYKYAKVKARDIMIAAKEGRTLQPPEPEPAEAPAAVGMPLDEEDEGGDETMPPPNHPPPAQDAPSAAAAGRTAFLDIPSVPQEPPRVLGGAPSPDPVRAPSPPIIDVPPPAEDGPNPGRVQRTPKIRAVLKAAAKPKAQIPTAELVQAEKAAKCALSALQFEDVRGAVGYLQQALATLTDAD